VTSREDNACKKAFDTCNNPYYKFIKGTADILDRDRGASNSMKFSSHLRSCINLGRANNMSRMAKIHIRGDF